MLHSRTGEDYVGATGIGRPSNLDPDRLWMLQSASAPNLPGGMKGSRICPDMSSSNIDGGLERVDLLWKVGHCSLSGW